MYGAICLTKTQESRDLWVRRVAGAYAEEELRIFKFRVKGGVAGCWLAAERLVTYTCGLLRTWNCCWGSKHHWAGVLFGVSF